MKKLTLGFPCYRGLIQDAHVAAYELLRQGLETSDQFQLHSFARVDCSSIAHGRNHLVHTALKDQADWLLMMDSDTYFATLDRPHPTVTMLHDALNQEAATVGAGVVLRDGSKRINVIRDESVGYMPGPDREMAPCITVGSAYLAVNLNWIRACWPKGPWFEDVLGYDETGPTRQSEDVVFCERIRKRGGLLLADTRFTPHHEGT